MKRMLFAVAALAMAGFAPGAQAQVPTLNGNAPLPQTIELPATVRGKHGPPTQTTLRFTINEFRRGREGTLCAVGVVNGAGIPTDTPVTVPAGPAGSRPNDGDCREHHDDDDDGDRHGSFQAPRFGADPAGAMALGLAQPGPYYGAIGGDVVQTQICTILDLVIGRIRLNLLGLIVDTTRTIRITITGDPAGGLLGNLLCALLGP